MRRRAAASRSPNSSTSSSSPTPSPAGSGHSTDATSPSHSSLLPPSMAAADLAGQGDTQQDDEGDDTQHVDIVNYPPHALLRLLAALLDQIAKTNDALHSAHASRTQHHDTPPHSSSSTGTMSRSSSASMPSSSFSTPRFDAAPLNSPAVTPRAPPPPPFPAASSDEYPVTPGLDLQYHASQSTSFTPSLGGAHSPHPLARRRGSSFLTNSSAASTSSAQPHPPTPGAEKEEPTALLTASTVALASPTATLCFHARNVPSISIESYLLRILKYCPTTNEVFLSLLVYFDRMARLALEGSVGSAEEAGASPTMSTPASPRRAFAIDSYNVHRLVIAGVTVASKFFSDVFYTNSRYAKVGGLPLTELNQLELQFLLLNDFRLTVPTEEMQRYADQLLLFWVGRQPPPSPLPSTPSSLAKIPDPRNPSSAPEGTVSIRSGLEIESTKAEDRERDGSESSGTSEASNSTVTPAVGSSASPPLSSTTSSAPESGNDEEEEEEEGMVVDHEDAAAEDDEITPSGPTVMDAESDRVGRPPPPSLRGSTLGDGQDVRMEE